MRYNKKAFFGLLISICSFALPFILINNGISEISLLLLPVLSITSFTITYISLQEIRERNEKGRFFATVGLLISMVGIIFSAILLMISGGWN